MRATLVLAGLLAGLGCRKAPPEADLEFSDAVRGTFVTFDGEEAELAYVMRSLEDAIHAGMDVFADKAADRALTPERLTEEDVAHLEHPDRDPALALPVAVAGISEHAVEEHVRVQLLADQTPVEPYSPDHFERTFLEGGDCWGSRDCGRMETLNDLVKENFLMTVPYVFYKDFRWVDLALPDPDEVPEGEEPTNDGEPRYAFVARSWTTERAEGEGGNSAIEQSYTVETWIPRDDGTTLRLLALWSETTFDGVDFSDDQVAGTTREGIDRNFQAVDDWLTDNPE